MIAAFRAEARELLPPQFVALTEATSAPFFQPIFDLESPRVVAGRVALLGDAGFVARPHVGAGVTKAALNAAWLADALAAAPDIGAALAAYESGRAPSVRRWWRAPAISAPIWRTAARRVAPDPLAMMQAIGAPLREIPELAGASEQKRKLPGTTPGPKLGALEN